MMNLGPMTKNWGTNQDPKPTKDTAKTMSATDKPFGDKDIGTVLNEIADPNYIDPAKVQRERKTDLDKDAFFKLMLTQMKNQDPMNPMQSHEMAAHLAQFTGLEQMFNINKHLEAMSAAQKPAGDYQALTFIGKEISADSSMVVRYKDDNSHELRFNLLGEASEAKIKITNEAGETVREMRLTALQKGKNSVRWDGHNDQGQKAGEGEYKFVIDASSSSGKKIAVDTNASGRISGVQFTRKGPLLLIGNQQVYLSDVKKISEGNNAPAVAPSISPNQLVNAPAGINLPQLQENKPQMAPSMSELAAAAPPAPKPEPVMIPETQRVAKTDSSKKGSSVRAKL